jgi:hypothetical protein
MAFVIQTKSWQALKGRAENDAQIVELNTAIALLGAGAVRDHLTMIRKNLETWPTVLYAGAWVLPLGRDAIQADVVKLTAAITLLPAGSPKTHLIMVRDTLNFELTTN